jgi:hypothetical protein
MCTLLYGASKVFNLSTICGEIRQTLDAKMCRVCKSFVAGPIYTVFCQLNCEAKKIP